jgi:hypothetical protein
LSGSVEHGVDDSLDVVVVKSGEAVAKVGGYSGGEACRDSQGAVFTAGERQFPGVEGP